MEITLFIGLIVLLLAMSGLFAGTETALTAVSRGRMHQLEKDGSRAARAVNFLVADRERLIGSILLGNTFLNILISSITTAFLTAALGEQAVVVVTGVMTVVILIFAEVLPKTLAIARTDRFALAVARPMKPVIAVLAPIVKSVQVVVWVVLGVFGVKNGENDEAAAHEEIRGTVDLHHMEGTVEREHRDMIGGVLDLVDLKVGDVMVHRKNVVTVDAGLAPAALFEALLAAQHSRVPVWRDTPENIVGVLYMREVLREFVRRGATLDGFDMLGLVSEPWFVPDTTTLEEQLRAFQHKRAHFALVVDEYGTLQGIVTLEDILSEIIGELPAEHEAQKAGVRKQADGTYVIEGSMPVRDLNRMFDWGLPEEEATTLAGLVIHEARTIPEKGQRFTFYGFTFEILRRQRNQIAALRVAPPAKNEIAEY